VTFSGVTVAVGGIPAAEFNNEFQITLVGSTPYIALPTTATSTATSSGNTAIIAKFDIYYWEYDSSFLSRAVTLQSVPGAIAVPREVDLFIVCVKWPLCSARLY
jgi:hypothetical protein